MRCGMITNETIIYQSSNEVDVSNIKATLRPSAMRENPIPYSQL